MDDEHFEKISSNSSFSKKISDARRTGEQFGSAKRQACHLARPISLVCAGLYVVACVWFTKSYEGPPGNTKIFPLKTLIPHKTRLNFSSILRTILSSRW
jgi:hypothetical protein